MTNEEENELEAMKVFIRNLNKATDVQRVSACNANCDCYIELEVTRAAGIAGYRYGM